MTDLVDDNSNNPAPAGTVTPVVTPTIDPPITMTPVSAGDILAPNNLARVAIGSIGTPTTFTPVGAGTISTPNALSRISAGDISAPNTLTGVTAGDISAPNTLNKIAAGSVATPNTLAPVAAQHINRVVKPIISFDFGNQIYSKDGQPQTFADITTFSRASTATYVETYIDNLSRKQKRIATAAVNVPRFEEKGLLVEGASTNLLRQSESADSVTWSKSNLIATANSDLALDGSQSAEKIRVSNGVILGGGYLIQAVTKATSPITYTASCYAKPDTVDSIILYCHGTAKTNRATVQINIVNGSVGVVQSIGDFTGLTARAEYVSNGYYRVSLSFTTNSDNFVTIRFYPTDTNVVTSDGSLGIIIWGMQLEELPFATSYIRTEGAAVSRAADVCSAPVSVSGGNYTVEAIGKNSQINSVNSHIISISVGASTSDYIGALVNINNNRVRAIGVNAGATQFDFIDGSITWEDTQTLSVNFTNGSASAFVNGDLIGSDSTVITNFYNTLYIGTLSGSSAPFYGNIKRIEIYDTVLTANEVKSL